MCDQALVTANVQDGIYQNTKKNPVRTPFILFDILQTVHLSIILVINQLNAQILVL